MDDPAQDAPEHPEPDQGPDEGPDPEPGTKSGAEPGPDAATEALVRRRRIEPCAAVERRVGGRFAQRSIGEPLRRLGLARLSAGPRPRRAMPKPGRYMKNVAERVRAAPPEAARGKPPEIGFQRVAMAPSPSSMALTGSLLGTVCPARATGAARVMPQAGTEAMDAHLAEISRHLASGARALLVLDGAGGHGSSSLVVPETSPCWR